MRINYGQLEIENIPLRYSWFKHPLISDMVVADCLTQIRDQQGERHLFFGHAGSDNVNEAIHRAGFEVLERLLAFGPTFGRDVSMLKFQAKPLFNPNADSIELDADIVLVRTGNKIGSASGLGFHESEALAIEHAVYELIERDLLCRIWYLQNTVLQIDQEILTDGFYINYYTESHNRIPFVLAIVHSKNIDMMYCGSRCSSNWQLSRQKAREEALLLLTNFLCRKQDSTLGNSADTIERINTLHGEKATQKIAHFTSKVDNNSVFLPLEEMTFDKLVLKYFRNISELLVVKVRRTRRYHLVKVISSDVVTKPLMRMMISRQQIPNIIPDPFC